MTSLKPFVINQTDLDFILSQLNFLPLFDSAGNAIILWDGTGSVYDSKGRLIGTGGAVAGDAASLAALAQYGGSYQSVTDLAGLRDVTGLNNNLSLVNAEWGSVDQIFTRSAAADYAGYSPIMQAVAEQAYAAAKTYYKSYSDGTTSGGFNLNGTLNTDYTISVVAPVDVTPTTQHAADGTPISIQNVVDYTPRMISLATTTAGVTYDTWANHQFLPDGTTLNPDASGHTLNEIYYDANGVATVLDWGQLATVADGGLGQVDPQARLAASAGQNDHFIGGLNPGVSPSNGFFVLFGQFFDHGLDFIGKSSGATIKIALAADDPLYGMLGSDGKPVHEITITRATVSTVDANGPEYVNHTSPFIDQSQTYGSHAQLTNLLREWVPDPTTASTTDFHAGMKLLDGTTLATAWTRPDGTLTNDTLPTLAELRAHVEATGRDALTWEDVGNLRNRDAQGHVITSGDGAGLSGSALLLDMNPRFDAGHLHGFYDTNGNGAKDGTEASYGTSAQAARVDAAIATLNADVKATYGSGADLHINANGVLELTGLPGVGTLSGASALFPWVNFATFDILQSHAVVNSAISVAVHSAVGEILLASVGDHYVAGDGRVNENFGLTSIHHVFHEEHNYQIDNLIDAIHRQDIVSGDTTHANLHSFQIDTGVMNAAGDFIYSDNSIAWDQDRMFNAAKLVVEMEYQHAAVDQYARNVTPNIQEFVGYSSSVNSDVTLEYSQAAFRFGHSTLRETIDTIDPTGGLTGKIMGYALKEAFLNPGKYADVGPSAVLLGMSHQQMNEVDEFITPALNQGLLGQPLDLAAINIARGRDIGIPTLNDFREAIGLARYTSWNDFGQNMQHPTSLEDFIAAYSFDGDMAKAHAIIGLVEGSIAEGTAEAQGFTLSQAYAFIDGGDSGFNHIDTWIGGLAEIHQPGGLLGETFDRVFVNQIESLMDGDRFYYLFRLAGQQFAEEVGNGQLKDIVERNTGLTHLNGNIFGYADEYVDLGAKKEVVAPGAEALTTGNEHKYGDITAVDDGTMGVYSNGGRGNLNDGHIVTIGGVQYVQDTRLADAADVQLNDGVNLDGTPNSGAESNEVIVGTKGNDLIYAQGGDDTVYGDGGNDSLYGGFGIDRLYGGEGSDHMYGGDNPDLMDGGAGDDFLYGESSGSDINGNDQVIGGSGNDLIFGGTGIDKLSGGTGDDRIYGDQDTDPFTHGSDGNDYVDGGTGGDILYGDNGDDVLVGGADQDQMFGGNGDDIIRPGDTTGALTIGTDEVLGGDGVADDGNKPGTRGFDLIDFSDNAVRPGGVTFNLADQQNPAVNVNGIPKQIAAFQTEGLIGSAGNDTLTGDTAGDAGLANAALDLGENWLIGGSGNDTLTGAGGNDVIVGGSIRLDALIGRYVDANGNLSTYDHNMNNAGNTEAEQLLDALYQGASHRVGYTDTLSGGLLQGAGFDRHFTELLRSEMFKDTMLGDGGVDGLADTAVFTGNLSDYKLTALDAQGAVVANPHANWASVAAIKVADQRDPLATDANGQLIPTDGTDLVIGVENFKFADQTINPQIYFDIAPTLDLHYALNTRTVADTFGTANFSSYTRSDGTANWASNWQESGDISSPNNGASGGAIRLVDTQPGNGQNWALQFDRETGANGDGASISRSIDLSAASAVITGGMTSHRPLLTFDLTKAGIGGGETLQVQYSSDGTNWSTLATYGDGTSATSNSTGLQTLDLSAKILTAHSAIRFVVSQLGSNNDYFRVDNVQIAFNADTDGNNYATSYTEQLTAAAVASTPRITDPDDTTIASAKIVLRDAIDGDTLNVGALPSGLTSSVDTSVAGKVTVTLTGTASWSVYQAVLASVTFSSTSDNPTNAARHIDVTVNDGLKDSAVATTTVSVTPVNDPTVPNADLVVTNSGTTSLSIPDWALLANDVDPDTTLTISSVGSGSGLSNGPTHSNAGTVTLTDNTTPGGTFKYHINGTSASIDPTVTLSQDTVGSLDGTAASEIIVGRNATNTINGNGGNDIILGGNAVDTITAGSGNDTIYGGQGNDIIAAGAGDDTIVWNANAGNNTPTDGRDRVDGGANTAVGDTYVVNGRAGAETFAIYSNTDDWDNNAGNGIVSSAAHAGFTGLNGNTEIVIARNGVAIAELDNIEEIFVNTLNTTANNGNNPTQPDGGTSGGDTIQVVGNFTATSLKYSTIHINGGDGNDTLDISGLTSDHRIVFHGGGGTDNVVGNLRPQDVVDSMGPTPSGGDAGSNPPPSGDGSAGPGGSDQNANGDDDDDQGSGTPDQTSGGATSTADPVHTVLGTDDADLLGGGTGDDLVSGLGGDDLIVGNDGADTLKGGGGDDLIKAGAGDDIAFGNSGDDDLFGGAGHDLLLGDGGNDRIFGDDGNDTLEGGAGNDVVYAGVGDDHILATINDGDDIYWGDAGSDTLDYAAITSDINANLGSGSLLHGSVNSTQGGHDTVFGFENFIGGSGNDTITANASVNILDGGNGHDTFVFGSAADANGDVIRDFQPGDTIDLSGIDANTGSAGNQSFVLFAGTGFTAAGQVIVTHETRDGVDHTMIAGNTNGDTTADFKLDLVGNHNVTQADLHGVN